MTLSGLKAKNICSNSRLKRKMWFDFLQQQVVLISVVISNKHESTYGVMRHYSITTQATRNIIVRCNVRQYKVRTKRPCTPCQRVLTAEAGDRQALVMASATKRGNTMMTC
eukprot:scaffold174195_cov18-Prasinocladus_malaysianus.AAC.1